jgi:hypothetical protein
MQPVQRDALSTNRIIFHRIASQAKVTFNTEQRNENQSTWGKGQRRWTYNKSTSRRQLQTNVKLTDMVKGPLWEARSIKKFLASYMPRSSSLCSQEPPIIHIPSHMNPIHTLPPYFFKINFNIIFPSTSRSHEWSPILLLVFWVKLCISHLAHGRPWLRRKINRKSMHATCSTNPILLDMIASIIQRGEPYF